MYVIPSIGGSPRQLTFHSADDIVVGWTPDGKKIIFTSSRDAGRLPGVTTLFEVSVDGGLAGADPNRLGLVTQAIRPTCPKVAFTRHPGVWSRQHYRGSYAVDLWLWDKHAGEYTRLGDDQYKGNYYWPMYGHDGQIYFVADRLPDEKNIKFGGPEVMKSANNIWKIPDHGGPMVQVTHHTDGNLFFPSMSPDGKTIVYEENFGIWKLDLESGKTSQIPIEIRSDLKDNDIELRTIQGEAESFNLSPSGKRAVIATHGEIFTIATDRGEEQRVTDTPWRKEDPRWSPDGKWIAFLSDRTGREEIFMSDELGHTVKQISDVDCDKGSITWAPDSKSLLWAGSDHKLRRVEIGSDKTDELVSERSRPDRLSAVFAGWKVDLVFEGRFIPPLARLRDEPCKPSGAHDRLASNSWWPKAPNGRRTGRNCCCSAASVRRRCRLLTARRCSSTACRSRISPKIPRIATSTPKPRPRPATTGAGPSGRAGPEWGLPPGAKAEVKIEWDGLDRRIKQLTHLPNGSVYTVVPSPDGHTYLLAAVGGGNDEGGGGAVLYAISEDGGRLTPSRRARRPATGRRFGGGGFGDPQWSREEDKSTTCRAARFTRLRHRAAAVRGEAGRTRSIEQRRRPAASAVGPCRERHRAAAPPVLHHAESISPSACCIDHAAERKQVFIEAWRVMRNRFYDRNMHGVDWDGMRRYVRIDAGQRRGQRRTA